jgi:hypothetical protein
MWETSTMRVSRDRSGICLVKSGHQNDNLLEFGYCFESRVSPWVVLETTFVGRLALCRKVSRSLICFVFLSNHSWRNFVFAATPVSWWWLSLRLHSLLSRARLQSLDPSADLDFGGDLEIGARLPSFQKTSLRNSLTVVSFQVLFASEFVAGICVLG